MNVVNLDNLPDRSRAHRLANLAMALLFEAECALASDDAREHALALRRIAERLRAETKSGRR